MTDPTADPVDGRAFAAGQAFILAAKTWWTTAMFPALRTEYEARARKARRRPRDVRDVAALVHGTPTYRYFGWLERHLQQMKYSRRYGLFPWHARRRRETEAQLDPKLLPAGLLELDPTLPVPDDFAAVDIHHHVGGLYGDAIAGAIYEHGARSTTPLAGARHADLHERLVDYVEAHGGAPRRLLDLGCGFGKSTRPFYRRFRDTEVTGIDIAAPCLTLAARTAADDQARNVRYKQRAAESTGLPAASVDLVTSTMLLHEMTPPAIAASFREAHRVLTPGGRLVHLDFHAISDPFLRFVHYGHGRRNNEPYMEPWAEMDAKAALKRAGFKNVRIEPFAETDGALDAGYRNWRFPWTIIAAEK